MTKKENENAKKKLYKINIRKFARVNTQLSSFCLILNSGIFTEFKNYTFRFERELFASPSRSGRSNGKNYSSTTTPPTDGTTRYDNNNNNNNIYL